MTDSEYNTTQYQHDNNDEIILTVYDVINMSFFVAIMIIGVFGNCLIIHVFGFKRRAFIKRFEGFLLMLGIIDLVASFVIPLSFLYLTSTNFQKWHFGEGGCRVIPSLLQISISLSQGMLIIISYERYHTLVRPFQSRIKKKTISLWLFLVFVLSLALVSPYMITFTIYDDPEYKIKTCMPSNQNILMLSSMLQVLRDIVAIIIMAFLNSRMNHALTKQHSSLTWEREKMSRKGRRLLKRVIIIFSGLTLPVDLYQVIIYALLLSNVTINQDTFFVINKLNTFLNVIQTSNSVVNVFIYSRMHDMFRLECFMPAKTRRRRGTTIYSTTETEVLTRNNSARSSL